MALKDFISKNAPTVVFNGTEAGAVPATGGATGKFLKDDGTWATPTATDSDAIHDNVAGEINAITEKVSPASTDLLLIEDSAAGNVKKKVQITNLPSGTPADASITNAKLANMAAWTLKMRNAGTTGDPSDTKISALTEETTPAAGDWLLGEASTGELRKIDVGDLPASPPNVDHVSGFFTATTTSGSAVLVSGMTITPPPGTYLVIGSVVGVCSSNNTNGGFSLYSGGSLVANTTHLVFGTMQIQVTMQGIVTVNGSQAIEIRFQRDSGNGTVEADTRTLSIIEVTEL